MKKSEELEDIKYSIARLCYDLQEVGMDMNEKDFKNMITKLENIKSSIDFRSLN